MFDSSLSRGLPIEFPIGTGQVIPGWDEGVANMKVGGKRQLDYSGLSLRTVQTWAWAT